MAFGSNAIEILIGLRDEASRKFSNVEKAALRSAASIRKIGLAFIGAGTATAAGLGAAFRATIRYGMEIDKISKQTGIAASEIQKLNYAAKQEHANTEVLNKGLMNLAVRIGYANDGLSTYVRAFEHLGIAYKNADGSARSAIDVFMDLADRFASGKISTMELYSALQVLGIRGGKELIPLLKLGREGIEKLMREAEELGIVMSEKNVKATKKFDDMLTKFKESLAGLGRAITTSLIPVFERWIEKGIEGVKNFQKLSPEVKGSIGKFLLFASAAMIVGGALAVVCSALKTMSILGSPLLLKIMAIVAAFDLVYRILSLVEAGIGKVLEGIGRFIRSVPVLGKIAGAIGRVFNIPWMRDLAENLERVGTRLTKLGMAGARKGGIVTVFEEGFGIKGLSLGKIVKPLFGITERVKTPETEWEETLRKAVIVRRFSEMGKTSQINIQATFQKSDEVLELLKKGIEKEMA